MPNNAPLTIFHATRPSTLSLTVAPFLVGAVVGAQINGWHLGWLGVCLVGVVAMHLAANVANEWFDFLSGADLAAAEMPDSFVTTPGVLLTGACSIQQAARLTLALFSLAGICGLTLMFGRNLWLGWVFLAGGLLSFFYTAPPLTLAYRGYGLGELAALIGFGFLPAIAAYNTQVMTPTWRPVLLTAPLGFLAVSLLVEHSYLHWEADKLAGKQTPVVVFGPGIAWMLLGCSIAAGYFCLAVNVALRLLPNWTLVLLLTLFPVTYSWLQIRLLTTADKYLRLIEFTSQTHLLFAGFTVAALLAMG